MSVVGANYGLGYRNLGTVGVVGPLRMDYATAIASVRDAAGELSRFFETVYEVGERAARLLRDPRRGPGSRRRRDQEGVSQAGARAPPRRQHRTTREAEEKFKEAAEAYEVLSDPEPPQHLRRLRPRGPALRRLGPAHRRLRQLRGHLRAFFGRGDPLFSELFGFGPRGPASGGDVAAQVEVSLAEVLDGRHREVSFEAVSTCEHCRGNGAEPGTPIRTCETLRRQRPAAPGGPDRLRPAGADRRLSRPAAATARCPRRPARSAAARAAPSARAPGRSRSRRGSSPASGSGSPEPGTPARRGHGPATSTCRCWSPRTSASSATARTWSRSSRCPRPGRCWAAR